MDDDNALRRALHSAEEGGPIRQINEQPEIAMGRAQQLFATGSQFVELFRSSGASEGAQMATVHAQVSFNDEAWPAAPPFRQFALVGRMKWGQSGAQFTAEVDIHEGSAFTLVASFADLSVGWDPGSPVEGRPSVVNVAAAVIWGTRPGRPLPTRTLRAGNIAAGAAFTFRVPEWAYAVQFHTPTNGFYSQGLGAVDITMHSGPLVADDPILVLSPADVGFSALTFDGIKLAEGVHYITVANAAGEPLIANLRAVFPLNL